MSDLKEMRTKDNNDNTYEVIRKRLRPSGLKPQSGELQAFFCMSRLEVMCLCVEVIVTTACTTVLRML